MSKLGIGVLVLIGPAAVMANVVSAGSLTIQCTATGAKFFASARSPDQICQHFVRAFGRASGAAVVGGAVSARRTGMIVELSFRSLGIASARVVWMRTGKPLALPVYELAVSDRKFLSSDVDRLAADAARGVTGRPNIEPGIGATRNERN